jgi:hypothetical protein
MKAAIVILLPFVLYGSAFGQTTATGRANTSGTCSPATTGNSNKFVINCGIGKEEGEKIIHLLNAVLAKRNLAEIDAKLAELIEMAAKPAPQVLDCVGSNCVQNGNQTNIDQRQFAAPQPPPHLLGVTMKELEPVATPNPMSGPLSSNPGASVSFTVDHVFQNAMFLLLCDRPCSSTSASVPGVSSPQMLSSAQNPRIAGVALGLMGPLFPGNPVTIEVRSADNQNVRILSVEGYVPPIQP